MEPEVVVDAAVDTATRVAKGYLNGTTRNQAYGIIAATTVTGLVAGTVGTLTMLKRKYTFEPKFVKVPRER